MDLPLQDSGIAKQPVDAAVAPSAISRSRKWLATIAICLASGLGVAIIKPSLFEQARTPVDPAVGGTRVFQTSTLATVDVAALGRLQPEGGTIALALPGGAGDARVASVLVAEGERVVAGQVIAELDNQSKLTAERDYAASKLAAEEAALEQVRAETRVGYANANYEKIRAQEAYSQAEQDMLRQRKLLDRGSITRVLMEQAELAAMQAKAELGRATAVFQRFDGALDDTQTEVVFAARYVDVARASLALANAAISGARVVAPQDGIILSVDIRAGEKPDSTGVVTLGNTDRMTADLEVYQADIARVSLGQAVHVQTPVFSEPLKGRVTSVGQMVNRMTVMSTDPAENAEAHIVRVTVTLDAESSERARSYTNLEVVGRIQVATP